MFRNIILSLYLIATVSCDSQCDNVICDRIPTKHYNELGCRPVIENSACCPSRFECPDKANYPLDKCHWNGRAYNFGEELPINQTSELCSAGCYCAEGLPNEGIPAEFICAQIECAHFFTSQLTECTKISTLDNCCPRHICDEEEKKTLGSTTCIVDGKRYRVGEKIYPDSHQCYACICAANFDNSTIVGNPACKEIDCGIGLRNFIDVRLGCIPNYYGSNGCCPIGWRCPRDTDVMIPSRLRSPISADTTQQCQFGKFVLNVGDEIKSDLECTECKCLIPPMAQCFRSPNCKI